MFFQEDILKAYRSFSSAITFGRDYSNYKSSCKEYYVVYVTF